MSYEETIADRLRAVNFDLTRMSNEDRARVLLLAHKAGIEIWRPGVIWASHREIGNYYRPAEVAAPAPR